jgi:hypothetical protein
MRSIGRVSNSIAPNQLLKALLKRLFTLFAPPVVENAGT